MQLLKQCFLSNEYNISSKFRCGQLIELMKVCVYSRLLSFLDLGQRSFTYEKLNLFFSETTGPFLTKLCM